MLDVSKFIQPGTWGSYDMGKSSPIFLNPNCLMSGYVLMPGEVASGSPGSPKWDLLSSATTFGALFLGGTGHLLTRKPRLKLALWHQKSPKSPGL